jgi:ketol-acid reductoisomerase
MANDEFADAADYLLGKKVVILAIVRRAFNQGLNIRYSRLDMAYALYQGGPSTKSVLHGFTL